MPTREDIVRQLLENQAPDSFNERWPGDSFIDRFRGDQSGPGFGGGVLDHYRSFQPSYRREVPGFDLPGLHGPPGRWEPPTNIGPPGDIPEPSNPWDRGLPTMRGGLDINRLLGGADRDDLTDITGTDGPTTGPFRDWEPTNNRGAYRPGLDPRTDFERSGGIAGLTRDAGNWIYDRSAEGAGTIAGGIGALSRGSGDYLRALTGGFPTGGSQGPTESFEDRFGASGYPRGTPPWQNPDVWPDMEVGGGSNLNRFRLPAQNPDVWPPMQGTPTDLVPGTSGDWRRRLLGNSNITAGFDPTSAGADYTLGNVPGRGFTGAQNPDVWPSGGSQDSFMDRFNFSRPSTDYTLPGYNPSGGFQDNFMDRFNFSRPSMDYSLPGYNPSGGFQDNFADRFNFSSPTSSFTDRFNFSRPSMDYSLPGYNPGANWQGPGGQGSIYDRSAALLGGGTGYQSPSTYTGRDAFALAHNLGTTSDPGFAYVRGFTPPPISAPQLTGSFTNWESNPYAFATPAHHIAPAGYNFTSTGNLINYTPTASGFIPGIGVPGGW